MLCDRQCMSTNSVHCLKQKTDQREMSGPFARGAQTMNSMFFKPAIRKAYHKKGTTPDSLRETMKQDAEEMRGKCQVGDGDGNYWVPHQQTGIYYPKGHEKVMESIPPAAAKDMGVNWLSHEENTFL